MAWRVAVMSSSSLKEGKMLYQPKFSTAIKRTTLVLLAVCVLGTVPMAAAQTSSTTSAVTAKAPGATQVTKDQSVMPPAQKAPAMNATQQPSPTPAPSPTSGPTL